MSGAILITPRSLSEGGDLALSALDRAGYALRFGPRGRTPSEAELLELVPGCVGWIAGVEPVSEAVVRAGAPGLKVISRNGVGTDNLPIRVCEDLGVEVRRADGANAQSVAELTIALMFSVLRQLPHADACLKRGEWLRRPGSELRGCKVGIVGFGAIGRKVGAMSTALGATLLVYDPFAPPGLGEVNAERVGFEELTSRARIVTLHCPSSSTSKPLVDREAVERMPTGACLINTARASLVDEDAVLLALNSGKLACYATDVFSREPPGRSALVSCDRVIATPHIGGFTVESIAKASAIAVANLLETLSGCTDVDLAG